MDDGINAVFAKYFFNEAAVSIVAVYAEDVLFQGLFVALREIIEGDDLISPIYEHIHCMGADVTRAAGD